MTDEQKPTTVVFGPGIMILPGGKRVFLPPTTITGAVRGQPKRPRQNVSTMAAADPGDDETSQ